MAELVRQHGSRGRRRHHIGVEIVDGTPTINLTVRHNNNLLVWSSVDKVVKLVHLVGHQVAGNAHDVVRRADGGVAFHALDGIGDAALLGDCRHAPDVEIVLMVLVGFHFHQRFGESLEVLLHLFGVLFGVAVGHDNHVEFLVRVARIEEFLSSRSGWGCHHFRSGRVERHLFLVDELLFGVALLEHDFHLGLGIRYEHRLLKGSRAVGSRGGGGIFLKQSAIGTSVELRACGVVLHHHAESAVVEGVDGVHKGAGPAARLGHEILHRDGVRLGGAGAQVVDTQGAVVEIGVEIDGENVGTYTRQQYRKCQYRNYFSHNDGVITSLYLLRCKFTTIFAIFKKNFFTG